MSAYPTFAEATRSADRAWDEMNHTGRVCAALLLDGCHDAAMARARLLPAQRDWWIEASQQARELLRDTR